MDNNKWYLSTWFIALCFAFWFLFFPAIIGITLLIIKMITDKKQKEQISLTYNQLLQENATLKNKFDELNAKFISTSNQNSQLLQENTNIKHQSDEINTKFTIISNQNSQLLQENTDMKHQINELGVNEYFETKEKLNNLNNEIQNNNVIIDKLRTEIHELQIKNDTLSKSVATQEHKISRSKEIYKSIIYAFDNFISLKIPYDNCLLSKKDLDDAELIAPSVTLKLHCMNVNSLRKAYKENEKLIDILLKQYSTRYTTKANKSIYDLMVIALMAELQNVLYALKYEKLNDAIQHIKDISAKYLKIAGDGNQTIVGTLTKFIGEIEYLFINAVKIEYNYYVKKEQAKQEQIALKEQMRQEIEERKALEQEKKSILREEEKFNTEINKLQDTMSLSTDNSEINKLKARILELQSQLSNIVVKKDEIINLQNGKAGTVYIISNIGSFGKDVFKVGMTRRLEPQDRINELGNASVPFKFDVHSFIFSQDAVSLENKMHEILNDMRVNKVNMRKEFFKIPIDELEKLVYEIEPTAEFNKTIIASEYRQSISSNDS